MVTISLVSPAKQPVLEVWQEGCYYRHHFKVVGPGRKHSEKRWQVDAEVSAGTWHYRLALGGGSYLPEQGHYTSQLNKLWIQDGEVFDYHPEPTLSASCVVKVPNFRGRLSKRALYIYLPRGYLEQAHRHYPVIYMHDGQNCFESFVEDSFAGSWQADLVADRAINQGQMRESIIVGVSNGEAQRMAEYLPPYASYQQPAVPCLEPDAKHKKPVVIKGRASATALYYRDDIASYITKYYRVLPGRDYTATVGSSMGGLVSAYMAWEYPDFAKHHALLSSAFWTTKNRNGSIETVERMRSKPKLPVRIWLDSGTGTSNVRGGSDDNKFVTLEAKQAMLEAGFTLGDNFQYYLAEGAQHHESAWAARLDKVFAFLFPLTSAA
jgi:predicted alpha/beta superfamily hydrolase